MICGFFQLFISPPPVLSLLMRSDKTDASFSAMIYAAAAIINGA